MMNRSIGTVKYVILKLGKIVNNYLVKLNKKEDYEMLES